MANKFNGFLKLPKEIIYIDNKEISISPDKLQKLLHSLDKCTKFAPYNKAFHIPYPDFKINPKNPGSTLAKAEYIYDYMMACTYYPSPWSDSLNYECKEVEMESFIKSNPILFFEYEEDNDGYPFYSKIYIKGNVLYQILINSEAYVYTYPFHPYDTDIKHVSYPYFANEDDMPYEPSKEELKAYKRMIKDGPLRHEMRFALKVQIGENIDSLYEEGKIRFLFKVVENDMEGCVKNRRIPLTEYYENSKYYIKKDSYIMYESSYTNHHTESRVDYYAKDDKIRAKAKRLHKKYVSMFPYDRTIRYFPLGDYFCSTFHFTWDQSDTDISPIQIERDWKYIYLCYENKFHIEPNFTKHVTGTMSNDMSAKEYFKVYERNPSRTYSDSNPGNYICSVSRNDHCFFITRCYHPSDPEEYYSFMDYVPNKPHGITVCECIEYYPESTWTSMSSFAYKHIQYYDELNECFVIPGSVEHDKRSSLVFNEHNGNTFVWDNDPYIKYAPEGCNYSSYIPEHIQELMDAYDNGEYDDLGFDW